MTADTYSSDAVGVLLMGTGNDNNTWGSNANTSIFQIIMDALTNALTSAVTGGTLDLSGTPPPAAPSSARYGALIFTGVLGSNQLVQVPNFAKFWWVKNATSGAFTLKFKTSAGSASTAIPQNSGWQLVQCDGSNAIVVSPFNSIQVQMPDGTVSAPAYSNLTEPTSGWYRAGTQDWRLSINGVAVLQCTGTGAGSASIINVLSPNALQVAGAGVVSQNSVFKAADGAVGAPGYTFNSETTGGIYRIGANNHGYSINGVKITEWNATTFIMNLAATVTGKLSLSSTDSFAAAKGTTGQRNGSPTVGDTRYNSTLNGLEYWNGTAWIVLGQAPTVQRFTTGGPLNYTPNPGVVRIRVRMCGGGGAGGFSGSGSGTGGGTTTFGGWTCTGGNFGVAGGGNRSGGSGGTGGATGTGTLINRVAGGAGGGGTGGSIAGPGGIGGNNPFGGAGQSGVNTQAGTAGSPNSGAGGGGAGAATNGGGGGGAGEYVEFWVNAPGVTSYTVGAGGVAGGTGTAGGDGAASVIIIEEFYS